MAALCPRCKSRLTGATCPKCAPARRSGSLPKKPARKPPYLLIGVVAALVVGIGVVAILSLRAKAEGRELAKEGEKRLAEMKAAGKKPEPPAPLKVIDRDFTLGVGQGDGGAFVSKVAGRYRVEVTATFGSIRTCVLPVKSEQQLTPEEEKQVAAELREVAESATEVFEGDAVPNQKYMVALAFSKPGGPALTGAAAVKAMASGGKGGLAKAHVTVTVTSK